MSSSRWQRPRSKRPINDFTKAFRSLENAYYSCHDPVPVQRHWREDQPWPDILPCSFVPLIPPSSIRPPLLYNYFSGINLLLHLTTQAHTKSTLQGSDLYHPELPPSHSNCQQQTTMSSAGNRGMISNNAGGPNWNFQKRNSGDTSANNGSTAERRRVSVVLSAEKEVSLLSTSLHIFFRGI